MAVAIGYKLMREKNGRLYPLYVFAEKEIPVGVWLKAEEGPRTESGKVSSRLGELAFRPGWHVNDLPYVTHIYSVHEGKSWLKDGCVWCRVEYGTDADYSEEAKAAGWRNGKWSASRAYLRRVPEGGFYRYRTNPQMYGEWAIAGEMRILGVLSDEEAERICRENGLDPLTRYRKVKGGRARNRNDESGDA